MRVLVKSQYGLDIDDSWGTSGFSTVTIEHTVVDAEPVLGTKRPAITTASPSSGATRGDPSGYTSSKDDHGGDIIG